MKNKKYIFGHHPVLEALKQERDIYKIYLLHSTKSEQRREIIKTASENFVPVQFVPSEKLKRMVPSGNHQGVVAVISPITFNNIEQLIPFWFENKILPVVVVLNEITDIHNLGAIARTAECSDVQAIIIPANKTAQINAQTVKASAGALFNIPVCRVINIKHTLVFLKQSGFQIISCSENANNLYTDNIYQPPLALIFGSEEYGISEELMKLSDYSVKIPLFGKIKSLNVSVTAGIILYEIIRKKKFNQKNQY